MSGLVVPSFSLPPAIETELRLGGYLRLAVLVAPRTRSKKKQLVMVRFEGESSDLLKDFIKVVYVFDLSINRASLLKAQLAQYYDLCAVRGVIRGHFTGRPRFVYPGCQFLGTKDDSWGTALLDRSATVSVLEGYTGGKEVIQVGYYSLVQVWEKLNVR